MRLPPASVEATWPAPNYVNPETRGPLLLRVESTLLVLSVIVVSLRAYVRGRMIRNFGWDDWFIFMAMVPTIGLTVTVCLAAQRYSWNVHIWDLPPDHLVPSRQISWAAQMIFCFATVLTKLSLLSLLLRIAHTKRFRYIIYTLMVLSVLYLPIFGGLLIGQCSPVSDYWNILSPHGKCIPELPPLIASCGYNLALDFIIYLLPMPTLWGVEIPVRQRIALISIFAMGSLVVIGGVFRIYWVWFCVAHTWDTTWNGFTLWMWTAVEINLGIICASLPTLKPLFSKFLDLKSISRSRGGYVNSHDYLGGSRGYGKGSRAAGQLSKGGAGNSTITKETSVIITNTKSGARTTTNVEEIALRDMDMVGQGQRGRWDYTESFGKSLPAAPGREREKSLGGSSKSTT